MAGIVEVEPAFEKNAARLPLTVLLDFHWCDQQKFENGVQLGGRAAVIRDPALRRTFHDRALRPFLERYGQHPAIHSIDVVNEPEWAIREVPKDYQVGDPVAIADMQAFVRECAALIHRLSAHKVTLGSARRKWIRHWRGLGLDLYQFHWYDKFAQEEPFPWAPAAELKLDKPCLIGEVPTRGTHHSPQQFLRAARAGGYAGLLFWSYRAKDDASGFANVDAGRSAACTLV